MINFEKMSPRGFGLFCFFTFLFFQAGTESIFRKITAMGNGESGILMLFFFIAAIVLGVYGMKLNRLQQGYLGLYFALACWSVEECLEVIIFPAPDKLFCPLHADHPFFWVTFESLPFAFILLFIYFAMLDFKIQVSEKIPLHLQVAMPFVFAGWILTGLSRGARTIFMYKGPAAYLIIGIFLSIFLMAFFNLLTTKNKEASPILTGLAIGSLVSTIFTVVFALQA